mgnify:CR=1 FL=1
MPEPQRSNYLYFPLANEAGMMSAVTPSLHGDAKTGQNSYLLSPVSVEDLQNSRAARNFWLYVDGFGPWSATGNSALQISQTFAREPAEHVTLEAGLLPTRLGYVVRCSNAEAVHTGGHTFLKLDKERVPLAPPTPEGMYELRRLYAEENKTQAFIDYGDKILFSMNEGDYIAPRI